MATLTLLRQGCIWRIGCGQSVKVFQDPWLPDHLWPYVESKPLQGMKDLTVADLKEGANWDFNLLNGLFTERDRNLILRIPLSLRSAADKWVWTHERKGEYTVKSAYRSMKIVHSNSNEVAQHQFWQKMWNMQVPPKVLNFL